MNTLLIFLLAVLVAFALWRTVLRSRKGGGCCGEHEAAEKKITAADRNKAHYPFAVSMKIGGMTCENCARKVENAINKQDGVWAIVSISDKTARVLCKTEPDENALREAVRQAGYVVLEVEKQGS